MTWKNVRITLFANTKEETTRKDVKTNMILGYIKTQ
jgi:hypothetical protein